MTAKQARVLREKSREDLRKQLAELRREAMNLRFQQASGQLENTARRRAVRREIARIHTLLREARVKEASDARA
ncbi:MAG: 50S ribosomal protein L29 [Alphaproteobacteria bacterium]|nr:50S ribosomal protein L29 [Alphaproteobacteria bacterium]MDA7982567.1 50S ribosomal protein L29 [Alphaproteobacteria bacterium]MDA7983961.1 50S ribosomal protein L29 [Alphaproteobacteria bacterium]MDA7986955.1 50S ribosomal protein L29 [Alphaproteobacteria bacterium]MDA7988114.1 50S ribosomal protein L29 [Alphaproteobacteria bacterium]